MQERKRRLTARDWYDLGRWAGLGTLACIAVATGYNYLAFRDLGGEVLQRALLSAVVLPVILAMPLFSYLTIKLRRLSIANRRLDVVARTDSLTACLNRGAFTEMVNAYLEQAKFGTAPQCGALLVIDADHFKAINDRFGHDNGDEALMTIARTVRAMLGTGDFVGRMGGEEFAVFLPGVDETTAQATAERIRKAVSLAVFAPGGQLQPLSVSIGGAVFAGDIEFSELFRLADRRLYEAKHFGRNRVEIALAHFSHFLRYQRQAAS